MPFSLGDAARATGAAKSTIFRAIKAGRLSATRSETGQWAIEPAELFRAFPPLVIPTATPAGVSPERDATADALVAELQRVIADLRADRDDLRTDRDAWRDQAQRLALPAPQPPKPPRQPFWPFRRPA